MSGLLTAAAVVASLIGAAVALYMAKPRRRETEAHTTEALTNAAMSLLAPMREEQQALREKVAANETTIASLTTTSAKQDEAICELRAEHAECLKRESEAKGEVAALHKRLTAHEEARAVTGPAGATGATGPPGPTGAAQ